MRRVVVTGGLISVLALGLIGTYRLHRTNKPTVLWMLEPDSWFRDRDAIVQHVRERVRPGSIILLHVEFPARVAERAALGPIIRDLKQRGYRFVTISELLALKNDDNVPEGDH